MSIKTRLSRRFSKTFLTVQIIDEGNYGKIVSASVNRHKVSTFDNVPTPFRPLPPTLASKRKKTYSLTIKNKPRYLALFCRSRHRTRHYKRFEDKPTTTVFCKAILFEKLVSDILIRRYKRSGRYDRNDFLKKCSFGDPGK